MTQPVDDPGFRAWALPPGAELEVGADPEREGDSPDGFRRIRFDDDGADRLADRLAGTREDLLSTPVREVARQLGRVGARFLDPGDPLRGEALQRLPATAGCSSAMARRVLDGMAADWSEERLWSLVEAEFDAPEALDRFVARGPREVRALGDRFALHLSAGTVPGVSVTSLIRSLLVKTPLLLKPGRGDVVLPVLFARALREDATPLAGSVAVVYWKGGGYEDAGPTGRAAEDALLQKADRVVVYGGDETVRSVRARLDPIVPLVSYHHRVSVALVGRPGVSRKGRERAARSVARAAALFDQRGCVSPHAIFVESGERAEAIGFVEALSRALDELAAELPPAPLDAGEAAELRQRRDSAELVALASGGELRSGPGGSVLYDPAGAIAPICGHRVIRVVPVEDLGEVPARLAPVRGHLQTVGVTGVDGERLAPLAEALARVGALRVAPMDAVSFPPPWWHHDGTGPLRALIRWIDVERVDAGKLDP